MLRMATFLTCLEGKKKKKINFNLAVCSQLNMPKKEKLSLTVETLVHTFITEACLSDRRCRKYTGRENFN